MKSLTSPPSDNMKNEETEEFNINSNSSSSQTKRKMARNPSFNPNENEMLFLNNSNFAQAESSHMEHPPSSKLSNFQSNQLDQISHKVKELTD